MAISLVGIHIHLGFVTFMVCSSPGAMNSFIIPSQRFFRAYEQTPILQVSLPYFSKSYGLLLGWMPRYQDSKWTTSFNYKDKDSAPTKWIPKMPIKVVIGRPG